MTNTEARGGEPEAPPLVSAAAEDAAPPLPPQSSGAESSRSAEDQADEVSPAQNSLLDYVGDREALLCI